MRDFDSERHERHEQREKELGDRSFIIGGEHFTYRANARYRVLRDMASITSDTEGAVVIDTIEEAVLQLIEEDGDAHARFHALIERANDPITFEDLTALCNWLIEEQFARPTQAPSLSIAGRETTGTPSTDISSSPPAVDSKA